VTVEDTGRTFRNAPVMKIAKVVDKSGGVLYEPGGKGGRGKGGYSQRPDWTYQDPAERQEERRSIEAQVAEKVAVDYYSALVQFSTDPETATLEGALRFAEAMATAVKDRIRKAASTATEKSGSGRRESGRSRRGSESASPEAASLPASQTDRADPGSVPEGSVPTPEPDSSVKNELPDARNAAIDVFGTPKKVEIAWGKTHDGEVKKFTTLSAEELMWLVTAAPQPEGGWS